MRNGGLRSGCHIGFARALPARDRGMHSTASTIPLSPQRRCGRESNDWRPLLHDGRGELVHTRTACGTAGCEAAATSDLQGPSRRGTGECTAPRAQSPFHRKDDVAASQMTGGRFCMTAAGNLFTQGRHAERRAAVTACKSPSGRISPPNGLHIDTEGLPVSKRSPANPTCGNQLTDRLRNS